MKKILISIFLLVFTLSLTGCLNNDGYGFVKPRVLRESNLSDFIKPTHTDTFKRESLGFCYFNSTKEEFEKYAEEVYNYLLEKDYRYFGYSGEVLNSLFGADPTYELILSSNLSGHYNEYFNDEKLDNINYEFVFGKEIDNSNKLVNDVLVRLTLKVDSTFENGYNTSLQVRNNRNLMSSFIYIPENLEFFEIEDAFNSGLLNRDELQEIADVLNGIKRSKTTYNIGYDIAAQKKYLETLINTAPYARIKDIYVFFYFDNEKGYVAQVKDCFTKYPTDKKEIIIDNVVITYTEPKPIFIKK